MRSNKDKKELPNGTEKPAHWAEQQKRVSPLTRAWKLTLGCQVCDGPKLMVFMLVR